MGDKTLLFTRFSVETFFSSYMGPVTHFLGHVRGGAVTTFQLVH